MLPREYRLRQGGDFARVRQQGRAFPHPWLVLTVAANGATMTRIGFVVSKRVGKAHVRNRVKRILRAIAWRYVPALAPGFDVVVTSRPAITGQPFAAIDDAVRRQLQLARVLARSHAPIVTSE
jgi:ribonuclease P protein component